MRRATQRVAEGNRDAGMTLTELLVSMIIFSIAIAMVFSAVILTMRWSQEVQQTSDANTELRNALAQIDRQVRSGNVLFSPADEPTHLASCAMVGAAADQAGTCMRIFTQSNGDQKCVQWQLTADLTTSNGTHLLQTRSWARDWQTSGDYSTWRTVARDLEFDITAPGVTAPFTLLGASTPYKERSLFVYLEVLDERRDEPIAITSTLTGRNTSYGYDAGECLPVPPA